MDDSELVPLLASELCATLKPVIGGRAALREYSSGLAEAFAAFVNSKGWTLAAILENNARQENLAELFSIGSKFEELRAKYGIKEHPLAAPLSNAIDSVRIRQCGSAELARAALESHEVDLRQRAAGAIARTVRMFPPQAERLGVKIRLVQC